MNLECVSKFAMKIKFMLMRNTPQAMRAFVAVAVLGLCLLNNSSAQQSHRRRAAQANSKPQARAVFSNPAIAGDYPDPSIIRVGADYWATSTSSEWALEFPLLHSRDLVNWEIVGAVFQERPEWSTGNYWAPEIAEHRGRFFVYYVGHKKDGPLCVAVATAARPAGLYTDHGPLVCQDAGAIDPVPVTNEKGERYLIWKEDGNSRNQPTPLWAQKLSDDGTKLVGEKQEILLNDAKWEAQLIEGPYVLRHGDYFYPFLFRQCLLRTRMQLCARCRAFAQSAWAMGKESGEPDSVGQPDLEMSGSRQHRDGSAWAHIFVLPCL
jgi:xylan 1,4-beta-xylosidase